MKLYPFSKGDIVASTLTNCRGVVLSVGQFGDQITALVVWFDSEEHEHVPVDKLKKSLRPIEGGKDPDI